MECSLYVASLDLQSLGSRKASTCMECFFLFTGVVIENMHFFAIENTILYSK